MTATFLLEQIDRVHATPLDSPPRWRIDFRSPHAGLHHQLYVDGELVDFTDSSAQRSFILNADAANRLVIAAVDAENRATDFSALLPSETDQADWVYRTTVVPPSGNTGGRLEVLGDHATGQIDPTPLMSIPLDNPATPRCGFGDGEFGDEAMGYDATGAAGIGRGAFGAGPFAFDAWPIALVVPLAEEGTHQLLLRVVGSDGGLTEMDPLSVVSTPPPAPPSSLTAVSYADGVLTLSLQ